jgi:hypothetical protein
MRASRMIEMREATYEVASVSLQGEPLDESEYVAFCEALGDAARGTTDRQEFHDAVKAFLASRGMHLVGFSPDGPTVALAIDRRP